MNTFGLDRIIQESDNHVMYYFEGDPERLFVSEELLLTSENTPVPPEDVKSSKTIGLVLHILVAFSL